MLRVLLAALALASGAVVAHADPAPALNKPEAAKPTAAKPGAVDPDLYDPAAAVNLTRKIGGYTYFNRQGADAAAHDAALKDCVADAANASQPDTYVYGGGSFLGAMVAAAVEAGIEYIADKRGAQANVENCMVVKGWRVVRLSDADGAAIAALDQPGRAARLAPLVGREPPEGSIARVWGNDAASARTVRLGNAGRVGHGSVSLMSLAPPPKSAPGAPADPPAPKPPKRPPTAGSKSVSLAKLGEPPAGSAVIFFRVKGTSFHSPLQLGFQREGAKPDEPAWRTDAQPYFLNAGKGLLFKAKGGDVYAYVVPPGHWRLAEIGDLLMTLDFCLGAPAFDVAAGEVVFAGDFDMGAETLAPDLNPDTAKALLAATPALAARLKLARYVNGSVNQCGVAIQEATGTAPSYLYAFEIKGAPFREGYALGSAVAGAAMAAAPVGATTPVVQPTAPVAPAVAALPAAAPVASPTAN